MLRKPHLKLIAVHSIRHGIRGGSGLVAVFATLAIGLLLASWVLSPLEQVEKLDSRFGDHFSDAEKEQFKSRANQEVIQIGGKAISWAIDPSPTLEEYLTVDKPVMVSAILVLLMLITPLLSCLAGFNQTAGDIATKGLRFLLIRTERPNIFFGRFVGTFLFSAAVYALLFLILIIYTAIKVKVHPPSDMALWLAQGYLRLMFLSLPYVALCAWVSCAIDSPFGSLVIALLITYFLPLLVLIGSIANDAVKYVNYITPWGFKYWLLEPFGPKLLGGIAIMFVFTAALLWAGVTYFSKRDL